MLQAAIDPYPDGLTKNQIADASSLSASGGTFSTDLRQLRRNVVEQRDGCAVSYFLSASSRSACSRWESGSPPPSTS